MPTSNQSKVIVTTVDNGSRSARRDRVATEEPLEMRLTAAGETRTLAVTMRTPGNDFELVAGFLFSEGLVSHRRDVVQLAKCVDRAMSEEQRYNTVTIELRAGIPELLGGLERHFYTSSACGVCGKTSLDDLHERGCEPLGKGPVVGSDVVYGLAEKLRAAQGVFSQTGGLHAAGLFTSQGHLVAVREDVGRHNALDKLIGWALLEDALPLADHVVMVSGRASYELAQKCLAARVPILCAVSAPSSLAVDLAERFGMTLIGFLRGERFNIYAGAERVAS